MHRLFLQILPPGYGHDVAWRLERSASDGGMDDGISSGRGSWAQCVEISGSQDPDEIIGIVPGDAVLLAAVDVPDTQLKQVDRGLPWLIEEQLAVDVESQHVVRAPGRPRSPVATAVTGVDAMQAWLDLLDGAGITVDRLVPDVLLLPQPSDASLARMGDRWLFRSGTNSGVVVDDALLEMTLTSALGGDDTPRDDAGPDEDSDDEGAAGTDADTRHVTLYAAESRDADRAETALRACLAEVTRVEIGDELALLAEGYQPAGLINLQTGPFERQRQRQASSLTWRAAAALAAMWLVLEIFIRAGTGLWLEVQARDLEAQAVALYKDIFPQDRRVRAHTIRSRMRAHLSGTDVQAAGGADFMSLFGTAASLLAANQAHVELVSFSESRDGLVIELNGPSFDAIERLREALEGRQLAVEISSLVQEGNAVRARLVIGPGAAA